jgi:helix-turn-helix protein
MRNPVFDSAAQPAADAHNEVGVELRGRPVSAPRRGRPRSKAADGIGAEIRRRRDLLGLTLREAAVATHVSPTIICEVERGTRMPSVRTYQKLRDGLGLTEPAATLVKRRAPDIPADNRYRATLAACVVTAGAVALADLAAAMGVSVPAVREACPCSTTVSLRSD